MKSSSLRIIAVLLALGAVLIGYMGYQASKTPEKQVVDATQPQTVQVNEYPVTIATHDISAGKILSESDISIVMTEKQYNDAYTSKQSLLGQQTRLDIIKGEIVLNQHLRQHGPLVEAIHSNERAVAINVDEVTGTGGFIKPGDHVDVVFYLPAGKEVGADSTARIILANTRILAYGDDLEVIDKEKIRQRSRAELNEETTHPKSSESDETEGVEEPQGKKSKTAVLAVKPADLPKLLLAESTGRLRLAVHGRPTSQTKNDTASEKIISLRSLSGNATNTTSMAKSSSKQPKYRATTSKVYVHKGANTEAITVKRGNTWN